MPSGKVFRLNRPDLSHRAFGYCSCKQARIQKSGTRDNNFVKWKGTFRSDRPDRTKWTTFKAGPEYPGPTKPKWSVPFDVPPEISREP